MKETAIQYPISDNSQLVVGMEFTLPCQAGQTTPTFVLAESNAGTPLSRVQQSRDFHPRLYFFKQTPCTGCRRKNWINGLSRQEQPKNPPVVVKVEMDRVYDKTASRDQDGLFPLATRVSIRDCFSYVDEDGLPGLDFLEGRREMGKLMRTETS